jgi:hypothetical protein
VTESRTCQQDPADGSDLPFCVLKSFPHNADHCAAWAALKVRRLLEDKPDKFNKFFAENSKDQVLLSIENGAALL